MSTAIASEPSHSNKSGRVSRLETALRGFLRQGLSPRQLALALALGATVGMLPTVWGTSLLCLLLAWALGLNQLVMQLANYLLYPLQILLFIPYLKLGEKLFSTQLLPRDLDSLWIHLQASPLRVLGRYWQVNLQAVVAWLLTSPLLLAAAFLLSLLLVEQLCPRKDAG